MASVTPGLVFTIVCDRGFALGIFTHKHDRLGHLIWLADEFWDEQPPLNAIAQVSRWRWCVFFPLGAAVRRRIVNPIGVVKVPEQLEHFPVLRQGGFGGRLAWTLYENGDLDHSVGLAKDPAIPIAMVVNDTRLKEMLVKNWKPSDEW